MEKDAEGQIKSVMLMGLPATSLEVKRNFSHGLYQNADGEKNGREWKLVLHQSADSEINEFSLADMSEDPT